MEQHIVTAASLQMKQADLQSRHVKAYEDRLARCMAEVKMICNVSPGKTYAMYEIPRHLHGDPPHVSYENSIQFVITSMRKNGFLIRRMNDDRLFISWDKEHISQEHTDEIKNARKKRRLGKRLDGDDEDYEDEEEPIMYSPQGVFGNLHLRAEVMKRNPKYSRHR